MSFLTKLFRHNPVSLASFRHPSLALQHRCESTNSEPKGQVMMTQIEEEFEEGEEEREARIEKLRHKSRLSPQHRNMVNGKVPYPESKAHYHDSVQYKRRTWARYGDQSEVYPGIAWPDKEELESYKEYEQVLNPLSIQEMIAIEKNKIAEEKLKFKKRYDTIVGKLEGNNKIITEFHKKKENREREMLESKKQKEKLFDEIRQHFGFNIDPRDEKFQEMVEIKKKEELKKRRLEKKKMREEKLISMALELDGGTAAQAQASESLEKKEGAKVEYTKESKDS